MNRMDLSSQYEEVSRRISRLLNEAAQKGHIELAREARADQAAPAPEMGQSRMTAETVLATEYLTPREVASKLSLSTDTVYTMLREGQLPAIRIGAGKRQVWRIPLSEFRRYLEAKRTGPAV